MKKQWISEHAKAAAELEQSGAYGPAAGAWADAHLDYHRVNDGKGTQREYCLRRRDFCLSAARHGWGFMS